MGNEMKLGREVALKTLPEEFDLDNDRLARFDRETRVLAAINHPSVVSIYGLEEGAVLPFPSVDVIE